LSFLFIHFFMVWISFWFFLPLSPMKHNGHPLQNTLHMLFKSFSA